jgi:hypothetical protein
MLAESGRHRHTVNALDKAASDARRLKTRIDVAYDLLQCGLYGEGLSLLTQVCGTLMLMLLTSLPPLQALAPVYLLRQKE